MKLRENIHEKGVKGCGKEKKKQNIEFFPENICWNEIKAVTLHPLKDNGPFVYRLGREIFIL